MSLLLLISVTVDNLDCTWNITSEQHKEYVLSGSVLVPREQSRSGRKV